MNLEGQGAAVVDRSEFDDRGYILVALLVGIAIAAVWMSAALPSWRQQAIREKESELAFRGEQYARAIYLYQQKMNQATPASVDDLVSQRVLRKKWKDPITGDDFLLKLGCSQIGGGIPGGGIPGGGIPGGGAPGRAGPTGTPARGGAPTIQAPIAGTPGPAGRPGQGGAPGQTPAQPGRGVSPPGQGGTPTGGLGGICGVYSKSQAASIRVYNGQTEYDLWQFDVNTYRNSLAMNARKSAALARHRQRYQGRAVCHPRDEAASNRALVVGQAAAAGPARAAAMARGTDPAVVAAARPCRRTSAVADVAGEISFLRFP